MRASDELGAVLRMAEALAAREPSRQVTLTHLAQALLRPAQDAIAQPRAGPPPEWSPAAAGATDRAMQLAASEGGQMAERRHLVAALAEIVSIKDMLAGTGPFIDHLPTRTPDGGITYHLEATTSGSLSFRKRDPEEPG
jgi:hypothetical protein